MLHFFVQRKNKNVEQQLNELDEQDKQLDKDITEKRNSNENFKIIQDINQDKEDHLKSNQHFQKKESIELKQIKTTQNNDFYQTERTSNQTQKESIIYNSQKQNDYQNQTENDHLLAQILHQELNQIPINQQRDNLQICDFEMQKRSKENQLRRNEVNLTEKEKNFLKKQQYELEMYNKQKEQNKNDFDLVEVNEEFINNIFNKQYPNNQQILDKIHKEKQIKNENQALQLQRRSQKQIIEQQKQQQQQLNNKQQLQSNKQQFIANYVSPNEKKPNQISSNSDFQNLLKEVEGVKYCDLCGEYQRQSQMESHNEKCKMANVICEFCNRQFPRYIINDHTIDCLRKEEFKLLDLYQRAFAEDGLQVNRTHQIFFGSRDYMRKQFNQQTFEQQKEIEKLIVQNQRKIKKSYQNKVSRSEYYADVKYVKDPQSSQAEDCCICFVTFVEKETLGMLPCAHKFHTSCIDSWIKVKKLCPLCKRSF
ncbi:zinc finger, C3HC4 type (RING finger) protein (macronuclear) [Tetrahymena thermophila SB210]|uniref:Zinc finger, C3HC4 type (RING finger) protein n=1 Tax=Tetrahymena thermophila (strain SB210) TaxID=312017 RepID=A4VCR3_TETTS|nr:zinc finger, C3HC4 type (RING finger) protein [Tetrahymena thermophila SB210]EDK31321.2 zinc finger, C3HC4 type (RING finger) protein [Tetrahymena thermophila SB210]|eukprot:XP_001471056.2 zinc finger, C3HC4 type (RING finger) protein [Tetrahymena thermophila SB210]